METIRSEGNMKMPKVNLDPIQGLVELGGRSTPENTESVYRPLIEWMEEYVQNPQENTTVNINFEYFNSSSAKYLIRFLEYVNKIKNSGNGYVVNWYYEDDELLEYGEDFQDVLELKFNFIPTQDYQG